MKKPEILVVTPVSHLPGVVEALRDVGNVILAEEVSEEDFISLVESADAVFTNPNKASFLLGEAQLSGARKLQVISTASTGLAHIDLGYAKKRAIEVLSLRSQIDLIEKISSTAEHALALTMSANRRIVSAHQSVLAGGWDYQEFIGRQTDFLTFGILGHGRLGSKYASFVSPLAGEVLFYDSDAGVVSDFAHRVGSMTELFEKSHVISLHCHLSDDTRGLISAQVLAHARHDLLLVNTARGEIVDENALVSFLQAHPEARYATDVLAGEIASPENSPVLQFARHSHQITVTPHIGGMTVEGQQIAYREAARQLKEFFSQA